MKGILAQTITVGTENLDVYEVPANKVGTLFVSLVNTSDTAIEIKIALSETTTPTTAEYIEYGFKLAPGAVIERTGILLQAGKHVVCSGGAGLACSVWGILKGEVV